MCTCWWEAEAREADVRPRRSAALSAGGAWRYWGNRSSTTSQKDRGGSVGQEAEGRTRGAETAGRRCQRRGGGEGEGRCGSAGWGGAARRTPRDRPGRVGGQQEPAAGGGVVEGACGPWWWWWW